MYRKPTLGVSACLLGENVRYDGGHKLDRRLRNALDPLVEWKPVCPEVECGMSVPRESVVLVGDPENPMLVGERSGTDHTEGMVRWIGSRLDETDLRELDGFVFKTRSPSCGIRDIPVCDENGRHCKRGGGLFARSFMERYPCLPVGDEFGLNDPERLENFVERIFIHRRWREFMRNRFSVSGLIAFHTDHKLLIMSHGPDRLRELGRIVSSADDQSLNTAAGRYLEILMETLKRVATVKKNVNVLQHAVGYFKKVLSPGEKRELVEAIRHYHQNRISLSVPMALLSQYAGRFEEPYLMRQQYLKPKPADRMRTKQNEPRRLPATQKNRQERKED